MQMDQTHRECRRHAQPRSADAHRARRPRRSAGGARQPRATCRRGFPASRRRTTGTWRSPTACATGCWSAGSARCRPTAARDVKVACYLSAEFLIGPAPGQQPPQPRHRGERARGDGGARPGPRRAARARRGAGPRQRRPRPARRLLPRLAGDAGDPGDRLRHPLRVRHLRPGDPRRLAGRGDRQVAAEGQPLGDRAPGR